MADAEVLKAAGLQGWHDFGSSVAVWFGVVAAVCGTISAFAVLSNYLIERHAQSKYDRELQASLIQEGLENPLWLESARSLTRLGFERREVGNGLVLFQRRPAQTSNNVPIVEAVIRRNGLTIAVAEIIALDASDSWQWASSDLMRDGSTVEEAVAQSNIPQHLASNSDAGIDVIGIGIASLARGQPSTPLPTEAAQAGLTERRAASLATEFRRTAGFVARRPVQYWTLDLGSAQTERLRDSAEEQRQRAAIIVALSRRMNVEGELSPADALALITTNVNAYGTDLTDFHNSGDPTSFLHPLP